MHDIVEASQSLVKMIGLTTRSTGMKNNLNLELEATIGGLWLFSLGGQAKPSHPHLSTVTFGDGSGAEVTVISPDTASDHSGEHGPKKAMRNGTRKPVEDMG